MARHRMPPRTGAAAQHRHRRRPAPRVRDYEQVDDEILGTLHPTRMVRRIGRRDPCMLIGAAAWVYQIYGGWGSRGTSRR